MEWMADGNNDLELPRPEAPVLASMQVAALVRLREAGA